MAKKRSGKCRNKHKVLGRGRARLLLLLRYAKLVSSHHFLLHVLSSVTICSICSYHCKQDAVEAADFKEYSFRTRESLSCWNPDSIGFNLIEHTLCHIVNKERPGAVLVFMTGWDDINSLKDQLQSHPLLGDPSRVLLLACHGSMASSEQVIALLILCFVFYA